MFASVFDEAVLPLDPAARRRPRRRASTGADPTTRPRRRNRPGAGGPALGDARRGHRRA
ncbi:hypothetical protein P9209_13860 [Prescottella defluvii]|nr:hypothetical protein P9209_13860 [Prescottella defluvii]